MCILTFIHSLRLYNAVCLERLFYFYFNLFHFCKCCLYALTDIPTQTQPVKTNHLILSGSALFITSLLLWSSYSGVKFFFLLGKKPNNISQKMQWIPQIKPIIGKKKKKKLGIFCNKQGLSVKFKPSAKCCSHPVPLHFLSAVKGKIQNIFQLETCLDVEA